MRRVRSGWLSPKKKLLGATEDPMKNSFFETSDIDNATRGHTGRTLKSSNDAINDANDSSVASLPMPALESPLVSNASPTASIVAISETLISAVGPMFLIRNARVPSRLSGHVAMGTVKGTRVVPSTAPNGRSPGLVTIGDGESFARVWSLDQHEERKSENGESLPDLSLRCSGLLQCRGVVNLLDVSVDGRRVAVVARPKASMHRHFLCLFSMPQARPLVVQLVDSEVLALAWSTHEARHLITAGDGYAKSVCLKSCFSILNRCTGFGNWTLTYLKDTLSVCHRVCDQRSRVFPF